MLHYSFDIFRLVSISDHNHEDPLDSILNGNNEATEDNASTNTPDFLMVLKVLVLVFKNSKTWF